MNRWPIVRIAAGVALIAIGAAALIRFSLFQAWMGGLSADDSVQPNSWLALRVLLTGCAGAGLTLLLWNPLRGGIARFGFALARLSERAFVIRLLTVTAALRALTIALLPPQIFLDYKHYDLLAQVWAATGSYVDGGHLTAFWPPGYPFFLSRLYWLFGHVP